MNKKQVKETNTCDKCNNPKDVLKYGYWCYILNKYITKKEKCPLK